MDTSIPLLDDALEASSFSGHALNAVDKKGRVSLPAEMRSAIEERAQIATRYGLTANPSLLLIRKDSKVPCLLGVDQAEHFRVAQMMRRAEAERFVAGADPWARGTGARDFATFERVVFDKAGRMVLGARLRKRAEIGEHAVFLGTWRGIEIWNPQLAHKQYSEEGVADIVDIIEEFCEDKGIAL